MFPRTTRFRQSVHGGFLEWRTVARRAAVAARVVGVAGGNRPLAGVAVSDGEEVRLTDRNGRAEFNLPITGDALRFIHVVVPAGFQSAGPWFWMVPPDETAGEYEIEFALAPDPGAGRDDFRFLVTGDSQGSGRIWAGQLAEDFGEISSLWGKPVFHVLTGDLAMTGWKDEWDGYAAARQRIRIRHYDVFGGHEGNYRRHLSETSQGDTGHFHIYSGPTWYSFDCGRFHCLAVNSVADYFETETSRRRQRRWIARDLAAAGNKPVLLFSHYTPEMMRHLNLPLRRVRYCFYGHYHENGVGRYRNIWTIRTAPLRGQDLGRLSAAVRVCDVRGETIRDELRPLGERRRIELAWPSGRVAAGRFPVVALAYDSATPVAKVTCLIRGARGRKRVVLRPSSQWTWRGDCDSSAIGPGRAGIRIAARDIRGRSWKLARTFTVLTGKTNPAARLGASWPAFRRDETTFRYTPDSPQPPFRLLWCAQTGGRNALFPSPVLENGRLFLGIQDERVDWPNGGAACYDPLTGAELWRTHLPSVEHTPAVRGDRLYVINCEAELCCLATRDGAVLWKTSFRGGVRSAMTSVIFHGRHILASGYMHQACLIHSGTGKILARYDLETYLTSAAAGCGGRVFGLKRGQPQACDARTGRRVWSADAPSIRLSPAPVFYKQMVLYVYGNIHALDMATGKQLWQCAAVTPSRAPSTPAIVGDTAYITGSLKCAAVDLVKRKPKWVYEWKVPKDLVRNARRNDPYLCMSSPAVTPELVIFGDDTGIVRALDRATGRLRWSWRIGIPLKSSPIVSGNMMFLQDYDGNLYGLAGAGKMNASNDS